MKRTALLCVVLIGIMPYCQAMDGKLTQKESDWLSKVYTAYTTQSAKQAMYEADGNKEFIRSSQINVFHHLIRMQGIVPRFDVLAHLIRQGAPIATNASQEAINAEERLFEAACIQQEQLLTCEDQESIAPISSDLITVASALVQAHSNRVSQKTERMMSLFSSETRKTVLKQARTAHEQDGTLDERFRHQTPNQLLMTGSIL